MKILLLSHVFPPAIDGGSKVIYKIGQYFESQHHQTLYLSSNCSSTDDFVKSKYKKISTIYHLKPTISVKTRLGIDSSIIETWAPILLAQDLDFLTIHGRTLKQAYAGTADWNEIKKDQKLLPNFRGKNKSWEIFERQRKIFEIYKKAKTKRPSFRITQKLKENGILSVEDETLKEIRKQYPKTTSEDIHKAINAMNKLNKGTK